VRSVDEFMSPSVLTIGRDQTLADAHRIMRSHRIRHLPVLYGGELLGIVSERDLHLIETLTGVDPELISVEEAMSSDVYVVPPKTPVFEVAAEMVKRKIGSVVVARGKEIVGIFTALDGLRLLNELTYAPEPEERHAEH
jgi:acetoin utilization protein AcuB